MVVFGEEPSVVVATALVVAVSWAAVVSSLLEPPQALSHNAIPNTAAVVADRRLRFTVP